MAQELLSIPNLDPAVQDPIPGVSKGQQDIPHKLLVGVVSPLGLALCVQLGFSGSLGRQRNSRAPTSAQVALESSCPGSLRGWVSGVSLRAMEMSSSRFLCGKFFSSDIPGNAAPALCLSKVYFGTPEELVSPGGEGMFGSHYSSFLQFFSREVLQK